MRQEQDVLKFKVYNETAKCAQIVRISEAAASLVSLMMKETGLSAKKIISDCIKFGFDHYEVEEM